MIGEGGDQLHRYSRESAMGRTIIRLLWVALLAIAFPASATDDFAISFIPASPLAGDQVAARLIWKPGTMCATDPASIVRSGGAITLTIHSNDTCSPLDVVPYRDFLLGAFTAGTHAFVFQGCYSNPPPLTSGCNTILETQLTIAAAGPVNTVPTLSPWGLLCLITGLIAVVVRATPTLKIRISRRNRTAATSSR